MSAPHRHQVQKEFRAESHSLWRIIFAPTIWAVHFLVSYGGAAVWCAKIAGPGAPIQGLRIGIGVGTVLALGVILWLGWQSWRQWDRIADGDIDNNKPTDEDRHQFLGNAAFLLSIISFIGVAYTAIPVIFIESCR